MNVTPPRCPHHGTRAMPMLRPGSWWCPTGYHLVLGPTLLNPNRPPLVVRRIIRSAPAA